MVLFMGWLLLALAILGPSYAVYLGWFARWRRIHALAGGGAVGRPMTVGADGLLHGANGAVSIAGGVQRARTWSALEGVRAGLPAVGTRVEVFGALAQHEAGFRDDATPRLAPLPGGAHVELLRDSLARVEEGARRALSYWRQWLVVATLIFAGLPLLSLLVGLSE